MEEKWQTPLKTWAKLVRTKQLHLGCTILQLTAHAMFRIQTAASIAVTHLDRTRQTSKKATDFHKLLITWLSRPKVFCPDGSSTTTLQTFQPKTQTAVRKRTHVSWVYWISTRSYKKSMLYFPTKYTKPLTAPSQKKETAGKPLYGDHRDDTTWLRMPTDMLLHAWSSFIYTACTVTHTKWQSEAKGVMPTIELAACHGRNQQEERLQLNWWYQPRVAAIA